MVSNCITCWVFFPLFFIYSTIFISTHEFSCFYSSYSLHHPTGGELGANQLLVGTYLPAGSTHHRLANSNCPIWHDIWMDLIFRLFLKFLQKNLSHFKYNVRKIVLRSLGNVSIFLLKMKDWNPRPWVPDLTVCLLISLRTTTPLKKRSTKENESTLTWITCLHVPKGTCWDSELSAPKLPLPRACSSLSLQGESKHSHLVFLSARRCYNNCAQELEAGNHFLAETRTPFVVLRVMIRQ